MFVIHFIFSAKIKVGDGRKKLRTTDRMHV